jgi:hypothetical protein
MPATTLEILKAYNEIANMKLVNGSQIYEWMEEQIIVVPNDTDSAVNGTLVKKLNETDIELTQGEENQAAFGFETVMIMKMLMQLMLAVIGVVFILFIGFIF